MMYTLTIELSWGLVQSPGILVRLLVFLQPYFFIPLDRDVLSPVTVNMLINQNFLNPIGVHHRFYPQHVFASSDL